MKDQHTRMLHGRLLPTFNGRSSRPWSILVC